MTKLVSEADLSHQRSLKRLQTEYGSGSAKQIRHRILQKLQNECLNLGNMISSLEGNLERNHRHLRHLSVVKSTHTGNMND